MYAMKGIYMLLVGCLFIVAACIVYIRASIEREYFNVVLHRVLCIVHSCKQRPYTTMNVMRSVKGNRSPMTWCSVWVCAFVDVFVCCVWDLDFFVFLHQIVCAHMRIFVIKKETVFLLRIRWTRWECGWRLHIFTCCCMLSAWHNK